MFTLLRGKDTERLENQRRAPTRRRQASEAGARQQRRGCHSRSEGGAGRPPPSGRGRGRPASGGADKGRPTPERAPPKPERARRALARRSVIATLGSGYGGPETPQWAERGRARLREGGGGRPERQGEREEPDPTSTSQDTTQEAGRDRRRNASSGEATGWRGRQGRRRRVARPQPQHPSHPTHTREAKPKQARRGRRRRARREGRGRAQVGGGRRREGTAEHATESAPRSTAGQATS